MTWFQKNMTLGKILSKRVQKNSAR